MGIIAQLRLMIALFVIHRALSNYAAKSANELSFKTEQILHITDTFVNGRLGFWKASIVGLDDNEGQPGLVPSSADLSIQR